MIHTHFHVIIRTQTTFFDQLAPPPPSLPPSLHIPPHVAPFVNSLTEELDEAAVAVRFVVLFFKRAFVELFQAEGAHKVLRVELLGHGCDAAARDWLLTAGAERAAALVVVHFTVGLAVVLEETAVHKRGEALLRTERGMRCYSICH